MFVNLFLVILNGVPPPFKFPRQSLNLLARGEAQGEENNDVIDGHATGDHIEDISIDNMIEQQNNCQNEADQQWQQLTTFFEPTPTRI